MQVPNRALRLAAASVPATFGVSVLVVVAGALHGATAWALAGLSAVMTLLLRGAAGEGAAGRMAMRARRLSESEQQALRPAIALMCRVGLGPPVVDLRSAPSRPGWVATPFGRRTVVVPAAVVKGLQHGVVSPAMAAASLCHAAAVARSGCCPGAALRMWCAPWALLRAISTPVRRLPLVRLAWQLRWAVVAVTVGQLAVAQQWGLLLVVVVVAAATYLVPAAERVLARRVEEVGDAAVVVHGLGPYYLEALARSGVCVSVARWERLTADTPRAGSPARVVALVPAGR